MPRQAGLEYRALTIYHEESERSEYYTSNTYNDVGI
jgi:hypothetical protein